MKLKKKYVTRINGVEKTFRSCKRAENYLHKKEHKFMNWLRKNGIEFKVENVDNKVVISICEVDYTFELFVKYVGRGYDKVALFTLAVIDYCINVDRLYKVCKDNKEDMLRTNDFSIISENMGLENGCVFDGDIFRNFLEKI